MNYYTWIILAALSAGFALELIASLLNVRATAGAPPEMFRGVIDHDQHEKSRAYLAARTHLSLIALSIEFFSLLVWWWLGGFNALDVWVRQWALGEIARGVIYTGILLFSVRLLLLPLSVYSTFVVEERFGFNKTTVKTFLADMVKTFIIGVALGAPFLAGVLFFFQQTGAHAWLYCWGAATLFLTVMQYIAPVWLFPLFNKFSPLPEGELKKAILDYARSVHFPIADIFEVDGSRRSTKANAFFTGFGKSRRIALFDTLIKNHSVAELVAVLAHEMGHYRHRHIIKSFVITVIYLGIVFYLLAFFLAQPGLYAAFHMNQPSIYSGLLFISLLLTPLDLIVGPLLKWFSRRNEFQADQFAVQTIDDPSALVSAFFKLAATNLANLTPHPLHVVLYESHPPLVARVQRIHRGMPVE